uniref:Uncharacterized protein n=1 Tax=Enterococcus faecium TaxID=1352 RepID=B3CKA5_ENTFC|nr:hypothetical protein [Enterococcus faecium]
MSSIGVHFSSRESLFYIYLAASTTSFNVDSTSLAIIVKLSSLIIVSMIWNSYWIEISF